MKFIENVYSAQFGFRDNGFCENSQVLSATKKYNMLSSVMREN